MGKFTDQKPSKQRIEDLQQRLSDIESLLGRSDLSAEIEISNTSASRTTTNIDDQNTIGNDRMASGFDSNIQQASQRQVQSLVTTTLGPAATHFKKLADLSASKTDAEKKATPSPSLDRITAPHNRVEIRTGMLQGTAERLFDDLPLFTADSFRNQLQQQLVAAEPENYTWTICLKALMGMALRLKAENSSFEEIAVLSLEAFREAHAALPNILGTNNIETALQAVLAMIMYLKTTANISLMALLLSTAVRLSQMLSQEVSELNTAPEALQRLCSITWLLDSELSLNHSIPSLFSSEPMELRHIAQEVMQSNYQNTSLSLRALFRRIDLAFLQSRILSELYLGKPLFLSNNDMISTVAELDSSLRRWLSNMPNDMKVESYIQPFSFTPTSSVRLHIAYNNCLTFVHWPFLRHCLTAKVHGMRHGEMELNIRPPELGNSITRIRSAARAIIKGFYQTETLSIAELW